MKNKKIKIAQSFQKWLLVLVVMAFLITTVFLYFFQTRLSEHNVVNLLRLNIKDVKQDIIDASNNNMVELSWKIAKELNEAESISSELLFELIDKYEVTEMNYINKEGIIEASTYEDFIDYDMRDGKQSAEFMVLLSGEREYVQSYQPVSYDSSILRKYGGVVLENGGFIQIGYGAEKFHNDIADNVQGITRNRHIGEDGCMIIVDKNMNIVSDRFGNEGKSINITGVDFNDNELVMNKVFEADVYGKSSYCMCIQTEGYRIIAVMLKSEASLSRDVAVLVTTIMQVIMFSALFILIYFLVRKLVVNNIYQIKDSLSDITDGKLDTVVNVRSHIEFDSLSNDINSTVDTLKKYISEAEARIDAELAFAKAIQHSAMPSVFPPYPGRKEFDIYATMHTAKEVGGDFYDFYFVDDETIAFLIADVSGKGIPAAMFMMTSKTIIKSCAESGMSVEEVFYAANNKLCEGNEAGMFVTAWMGYFNIKTGILKYVNAGHNPPLIKHEKKDFEYMKSRVGFVLAGMENMIYPLNEIKLNPGDIIYLYTDGVTEATNMDEELYGEDRLDEIMNKNINLTTEIICEKVKEDVDDFVLDAPQNDDITMLCFKYNGV